MSSSREDDLNNKPLDKLPEPEPTPETKEETKDSSSFVSKFDIKFRDDCVSCKYISAAVCYGCGVIVLQTVKSIPASNLPAKVMTGIFGAGLFGIGTMRLFQEPTKSSVEQTSNPSTNQDNT